MQFEQNLTGKILDPIHGIIRITKIERDVIDHPLFQRLRTIKQNSFLYKVFPSAMHSRFEHSLGVMHLAYKMYTNLVLNSYRYSEKYQDDKLLFAQISELDTYTDLNNKHFIQELRLAGLLHDIGHGPMSHLFEKFALTKEQLESFVGIDYQDITQTVSKGVVAHEQFSLLFIKKIFNDLNLDKKGLNLENILSLIDATYNEKSKNKDFAITSKTCDITYNIQPLLASLISAGPIDADRMDYLLRDSYFSGVKCGIYNIERLLMSVIPIIDKNNCVTLAFKGSSIDSIAEFIFARMNLFSQVYYHKTNRAFSAMLNQAAAFENKDCFIKALYNIASIDEDDLNFEKLENFFIKNSDEYFIEHFIDLLEKKITEIEVQNETDDAAIKTNLDTQIEKNSLQTINKKAHSYIAARTIIQDITQRKPWKKIHDSTKCISVKELQSSNLTEKQFEQQECKNLYQEIEKVLTGFSKSLTTKDYIIDILSDNSFKDMNKENIKLLIKNQAGLYEAKSMLESQKLQCCHSIRFFVRVFVNPSWIANQSKNLSEKCSKETIQRDLNQAIDTYWDNKGSLLKRFLAIFS